MTISPLQVCLDGLNCEAEGGSRLDCLSMVKKLKVRHTCKAETRHPRLGLMVQRLCRSRCKMGGCHKGRALMDMSAALSMDDTWKDLVVWPTPCAES